MRACVVERDFAGGDDGAVGLVVAAVIDDLLLPFLDDVLVIGQGEIERGAVAAALLPANQPCDKARGDAIAQDAAQQQDAPCGGVFAVVVVAGGGDDVGRGGGKAELGGQPGECVDDLGEVLVGEQGALPVELVLAHGEQDEAGGKHAEQPAQGELVAEAAARPAKRGLGGGLDVVFQQNLVDGVFQAACEPEWGGGGRAVFLGERDKPGDEHHGVAAEYADEDEHEIQAALLHQLISAEQPDGKPCEAGEAAGEAQAVLMLGEAVGDVLVAVDELGAAVELGFDAAVGLAQDFGDGGGVAGENVAALFQQADEFGVVVGHFQAAFGWQGCLVCDWGVEAVAFAQYHAALVDGAPVERECSAYLADAEGFKQGAA